MPKRPEIAELATSLFDDFLADRGIEKAWLGTYVVLLWYERINEVTYLPHIIDADKLRPPGHKSGGRSTAWVERASKINLFLSGELGCEPSAVPDHVDKLMHTPVYEGVQRQNPLGIAFAELVTHVLRRFGAAGLNYRTEVAAEELFPGVKLQSRSKHPSIDIVALRDNTPVVLITTKWSIRHDRLMDVIDESLSYRAAAMRLGLRLPCIFVTNEFDPARLDKVIGNGVLESVVHVCPKLVTEVCGLNGRLAQLKDLPYLVAQTHLW